MLELLTRVLCDPLPTQPADGVFLFGQTTDNQESIFERGRQLVQQGQTKKVLFMETKAMSGYPGFAAWQRELVKRGIPETLLEGVPFTDTSILHTLIEAECMAQHAQRKNYRTLIVMAAPFHQLRAFMTAVTAVQRHYPELRLYSQPGVALPWTDEVAHSQGTVTGTRAALIAGELERITKYQAQGNILPAEDVLAYLNGR